MSNITTQDVITVLTSIVSIASVIANLTPTDRDNKAIGVVSNIIHLLAGNLFALGGNKTNPKG